MTKKGDDVILTTLTTKKCPEKYEETLAKEKF